MPVMIYSVLKKDHDELKPMLKQLAMGDEGPLTRMASELKAHSEAEEKTFYKRLEAEQATKDLVAEGTKEHKEADRLSKQLIKAKGDREKFMTTAKKLQEAVLHHMKEEEGTMFTQAHAVLPAAEARAMVGDFQAQKEKLLSRMMAKV